MNKSKDWKNTAYEQADSWAPWSIMKRKIPGEWSPCILIAVAGMRKWNNTHDDLSEAIKPRSEED